MSEVLRAPVTCVKMLKKDRGAVLSMYLREMSQESINNSECTSCLETNRCRQDPPNVLRLAASNVNLLNSAMTMVSKAAQHFDACKSKIAPMTLR